MDSVTVIDCPAEKEPLNCSVPYREPSGRAQFVFMNELFEKFATAAIAVPEKEFPEKLICPNPSPTQPV
jgi:hypothetical protein